MAKAVDVLKRAVVVEDIELIGGAVESLRRAGFNYKSIYRCALAGRPGLTVAEWDDLMVRVEEMESKR